jgi:predicted acetyltransferase
MGAGTKYDFTAEGNRYKANPASYSIPSVFDMNKFKAKGVGFRVSRNVWQSFTISKPDRTRT